MALSVVVTYDIHEDQRRAQVAAALQIHGDRVQKSVFICTLPPQDLQQLQDHVASLIDPDTDAVHVFRQCAACWDDIHVIGQARTVEPGYHWAVL